MKIVVVDHIQRLQSIGDLEVFKDLAKTHDEMKERIKAADIVIVGWSNLTKDVIKSAEKLKMVSIWATTCHYVDLQTAWERGIVVTHVPGYATEAVAKHTFALLLAAIRKLPIHYALSTLLNSSRMRPKIQL